MPGRKVEVELSVKNRVTKAYNKISKDIGKNNKQIRQGLKSVEKQSEKTADKMKKSFGGMKLAIGAVAALATGVLVRSFIKAGSEVEDLSVQFEVLLGSAEKAKKRMEELALFAQTTPFQLAEVAKASRLLEVLTAGALSTGDALRTVGDAAAASGGSFEELAMWVGRAYAGLQANRPVGEAMARLTELGIVSAEVRGKIEALQQAGKGKEAWTVLEQTLERSKGGMEKLSKTVTGLTSTIKDQLQAVIRQILDSGLWDKLRDVMGKVVNSLNKAIESGVFEKWGQALIKIGSNLDVVLRIGRDFLIVFAAKQLAVIAGAIVAFSQKLIAINPVLAGMTALLIGVELAIKAVDKQAEKFKGKDGILSDDENKKLRQALIGINNLNKGIAETQDQWRKAETWKETKKLERIILAANNRLKDQQKIVQDLRGEGFGATEESRNALIHSLDLAIAKTKELKAVTTAEDTKPKAPEILGPILGPDEGDARANKIMVQREITKEKAHQDQLKRWEDAAEANAQMTAKIRADDQELINSRLRLADVSMSSISSLVGALGGLAKVRTDNDVKAAKAAGKSEEQIDAIRKKGFEKQKKYSLISAIINTAQAVTSALATQPFIPLGLISAATAAAAGAVQVAAISSQKFAGGGFVGEGSVQGDRTTALVNRGEMILNAGQQRNILALANGRSGAGQSNISFGDININAPGGTAESIGETVNRTMQERIRELSDVLNEKDALLVT